MPQLSFIIPCKNDLLIKRLLRALSRQTFRDFEVVIVDSSDTRLDYSQFPLNLKVIRADCWIGTARNIGAEHANGDIIAYVDADTVVPPDFAETIVQIFNSEPSLVGLAIPIYPTKVNPFINLIYKFQRFLIEFSFRFGRPRISGACCVYRRRILKLRRFLDLVGDDILFSSDAPKLGKVAFTRKVRAYEEPRRWTSGTKALKSFIYYLPSYILLLLMMIGAHKPLSRRSMCA